MGIDLHSDDLLTLGQAARHFPVRPSTRTLWRWIYDGCRGVKLGSALVGGRRVTSRQAIERFLDQINGDDAHSGGGPSRRRQVAVSQAEREMDQAGL